MTETLATIIVVLIVAAVVYVGIGFFLFAYALAMCSKQDAEGLTMPSLLLFAVVAIGAWPVFAFLHLLEWFRNKS